MVNLSSTLSHAEWTSVQQLFHDALEKDETERERWLESQHASVRVRREAESLLWSLYRHERLSRTAPKGLEAPAGFGDLSGELCGPYRLERLIAGGGMSWVYEAVRYSGEFRHRAAVKVIPSLFGPEMLERFRHEKQILAEMNHPAIAHLLDGGLTEQGLSYLAMEYVDGEPITTYARRNRLDRAACIRLVLQVCDAVAYAHDCHVVHRDIKPGNILVTAKGEAKLLDFGIAKLFGPGEEDTLTVWRAHTPRYASPEQLRGEPAGTASDIYQIGVLLSELLAGEKIEDEKRLRKQLGADMASILLIAMQSDPARRYASVALLADDLRHHLSGRPVSANPRFSVGHVARWVMRHGGMVSAGAVSMLIIAGVWMNQEAEQRRREALVATFDGRPIISGSSELDPSEMAWYYKNYIRLGESLEQARKADPRNVKLLKMIGSNYQEAGLLAWSRYTPSMGEVDQAYVNLERAQVSFEAGAKADPAQADSALVTRMAIASLLAEKGQGWRGLENAVQVILAERELNRKQRTPATAFNLAANIDMLSDQMGGQNWWKAEDFPPPFSDLIRFRPYSVSDQAAIVYYRAALRPVRNPPEMGEALADIQLGRLEHQNGMREEGLRTLQLAKELFESFRGAVPGAMLQRRIDSTQYAMCRALADEGRYQAAWEHCNTAIAATELRAARHPQNRYLQESMGQHELDAAAVLGSLGDRRQARRRAEMGLETLTHDVDLPHAASYALDFAAQRLLLVQPATLRNQKLALTYAERAVNVSAGEVPAYLVTLAVAERACGRDAEARETSRRAIAGQHRVLDTIAPLFTSETDDVMAGPFRQLYEQLHQLDGKL